IVTQSLELLCATLSEIQSFRSGKMASLHKAPWNSETAIVIIGSFLQKMLSVAVVVCALLNKAYAHHPAGHHHPAEHVILIGLDGLQVSALHAALEAGDAPQLQ